MISPFQAAGAHRSKTDAETMTQAVSEAVDSAEVVIMQLTQLNCVGPFSAMLALQLRNTFPTCYFHK